MNKILSVSLAVAIIVGGGAFYGGMKFAAPVPMLNRALSRNDNGSGSPGRGGNRMAGNFFNGQIIAQDDKSITVKLPDGGSKIIFYSEATEINKSVNGAAADLKIGATVAANGPANADGSITAQSIQIRPVAPKPN